MRMVQELYTPQYSTSPDPQGENATFEEVCEFFLGHCKDTLGFYIALEQEIKAGRGGEFGWSYMCLSQEEQEDGIARWIAEAKTRVNNWEARLASGAFPRRGG